MSVGSRDAAEHARAHADEWRRFLREKGVASDSTAAVGELANAARLELPPLETLAEQAEARAARARRHAEIARSRADQELAQGEHEAADRHLREANAHENAARVSERTAALYRERIRKESR